MDAQALWCTVVNASSFTSDPRRQPEEGLGRETCKIRMMTTRKEVSGLGLCGVQGLPCKQKPRNKELRDVSEVGDIRSAAGFTAG